MHNLVRLIGFFREFFNLNPNLNYWKQLENKQEMNNCIN